MMTKRRIRRRRRRTTRGPIGAPPGTLVAHADADPTRVSVISYDPSHVEERVVADLDEASTLMKRHRVGWLDVVGLADTDVIAEVGRRFELHPLALEDAVNTHQRPKVEEYPGVTFVVVRMPSYDEENGLDVEQVSLFLSEGRVVTFQEREGDCFEPVRNRIRQARGRVRDSGADYLAYALLDSVIDAYFPIVERYGDRLEELEGRVFADPAAELVDELHRLRRELGTMRRAVWPLREALQTLIRDEHSPVTEQTRLFLRDTLDHTFQLVELVEAHREIAAGLLDVYLSSVSNRMNEVMKVLTIIATIFIPLGFVAGVYGMNFDPDASPYNMPELGWRYGYPAALGAMVAIALGMLAYFRKKRWI